MGLPALLVTLLVPVLQGQEEFKQGDEVRIQTLRVGLRTRTSMLAKPFSELVRGDLVTVQSVDKTKRWLQVVHTDEKKRTRTGWIPRQAAMSKEKFDATEAKRKIDPDNPNEVKGAAGAEGAAAKGFNPQTEAKRRKDDAELNKAYVKLDSLQGLMDRKNVDSLLSELEQFRQGGNLGEFRQ